MTKETREKLALFSGLSSERVIGNWDVSHLLEAVLLLEN